MSERSTVTLVIPARDAGKTMGACLTAVDRVREQVGGALKHVIVVDDGSKDDTREVIQQFDVELLESGGQGAGAARNIGWRHAKTPLVWFVDSDCEPDVDSLTALLPHMDDARVGGVGGTYGIRSKPTLLERLIHEEIVARHARMKTEVNFLATYNVLYRREVLENLNGFDERYYKGQDAEFAFRVIEAGHILHFNHDSVVMHHHEQQFGRYLYIQRLQGYWRVALHLEHSGHSAGDSYSSLSDHIQPFLPVLFLAFLPLVFFPWGWVFSAACLLALVIAQVPRSLELIRRTSDVRMAAFVVMSTIRAFWRSTGLVQGVIDRILKRGPIAPQRLGAHGS